MLDICSHHNHEKEMNVQNQNVSFTLKFIKKIYLSEINFVYITLQHSLLQQLLSHFQQHYKYLLSSLNRKNVLRSDKRPQELSFIINHFPSTST